jgi:hypothetical protein
MDYERDYAPLMKRLIAMFPQRPISDETIAVYWEMLSDLDAEAFALAVKDCGRSGDWFPTIHQLRAASRRARIELDGYDKERYQELMPGVYIER